MFKSIIVIMGIVTFALADGPVLKTGQTTSYTVFDDGYYQKGVDRDYIRSSSGVVTDKITTLQWQDDYSDNNGNLVLKPWITQANYDASDYDNTSGDTAMTYCTELALDGGGWRLPNRSELSSLINYGSDNGLRIDLIFMHVASSDYWTSSTLSNTLYRAWRIYFTDTTNDQYFSDYKYKSNYVRCVRGGRLASSNFIRSENTVIDNITGLQWQDDRVGTTTMSWSEAIEYCENFTLNGYNNWRLPNVNELNSIVDDTRLYQPAIYDTFQNVSSGNYWSSTTYHNYTSWAWNIHFGNGNLDFYGFKSNSYYARCVRRESYSPLIFTDFTFNGSNDLVWHQLSTGAVKIMEMNRLISEANITVVNTSNTNLIPKGIGDFNGDGKPDILVHNQNTGMARVWLMNGTTRTANVALLDSSNTNLQIAGVGDFDNDGDNDIAAFNANSGALIIWVMDGTTKLRNETVLTGANVNLAPKGVGDMNNDGISDIVLRNNNSGAVRVWTMNNNFTRKGNEYVTGSSNTNLELRGVVDIDGDGNSDILNYNTNTGRLRAWLMDGSMGILENSEVVQDSDLDWSVRN